MADLHRDFFRNDPDLGRPSAKTGVTGKTPILISGRWTRLESRSLGMLLFMIIFGVAFNAMLWFFLVGTWGTGDGVAFIFGLPFIFVGLGLVGGIAYWVISLRGPVFEIMIEEADPLPGVPVKIHWRRAGGRKNPQSLAVYLIGREEAREIGEPTKTSVFYESCLLETRSPGEMTAGSVEAVLPAGVPPAVYGDYNGICWLIRLQCRLSPRIVFAPYAHFRVRPPLSA
ncbi:MAG: hypothetical protein JWO82_2656 [Akkermansiaceae bacterium]|nr:hypothetical protein [Akkermansiaceae bacterium]